MHEFIAKHENHIAGVLSGFDRLVFRGTLRSISWAEGMNHYLHANDVLLKDFGTHVERVSQHLKQASLAGAECTGRPIRYLPSAGTSKEEIARGIALQDHIESGLICVLKAVEPCWTFAVYRNREAKKLELQLRRRQCLFLYHYWMHPTLGFLHARIQTWFPFSIQVCLNGREWLARQMDRAGLKYQRQGNCFPWIKDWDKAQRLMNRQVEANWPKLLGAIAKQLNPIHEEIFQAHPVNYYWSTYQSEWAIDVVFGQAHVLRELYPRLLRHGMTTFGSADVMRFLGRHLPLSGQVPKRFQGEVVSDLKQRAEGIRIKHRLNGNSVKLYDKAYTSAGSVLRAETTLQQGDDIRVYRPKEGAPEGKLSWRPMRRGIADLHRRAEVSRQATERYLDALASLEEDATLHELVQRLSQPRRWRKQRVRALHPFAPEDRALLEAVSRAEFTLNGFRNRDLRTVFFPRDAGNEREARRRSAWVSRRLRLLRAHGLIHKLPGTHRYQLTVGGRKAITAILTALNSTVKQLVAAA
jgi:hypothetical protein